MIEIIKQEIQNLRSPLYLNSIYISLSSMVTAVASFVFWSIATHLYSPSDVGVASALISALNLVFSISLLGLNVSIIRFYPKYGERVVGSALILTLIASSLASIGYALIISRSESFSEVSSVKFLVMFVLFSAVGATYNLLSTYMIAKRKAEHSFVQSILFSLRFLFLFVLVSFGALGIVSSFGLGLALGVLYGFIVIDSIKLKLDREFLRDSFKFSLGNYVASMFNVAPNYLMPTIVLSTLEKSEAAYFYIAFSIGSLILIVPNAINTSFFVEGSHGIKDLKQSLKKALVFSYIYLTFATVFVWFFGGFLLRSFGEEYVKGLGLLKLMILGSFFGVFVNFLIMLLNIQKRVREVVIANALKAVLFLGFSYLLISRFGVDGVGWAWIVTYAGMALFLGFNIANDVE
ncbi:lipopolysaccharide biosynthesis protein [Thermococcus sp. Bubb.Bath]|uniref:lipopolysaccharide biosynthesis protein n=1 Tax=Thermococcus sp. Bubb.Bath TaxID=1638242 RepID=UPI001438BBB0|nr:polysaccharide biosynthesis C-terminal domain-containing protein [Thermococcus sp. Bubb.Bath]NJF25157.1 lipopolysaccharide biosynthesis protein [Thermococcus sp. Bubb.Bath]